MAKHAVLSPSSAERWISCPASIRMIAEVGPGATSTYAEEGTCAHALAEIEGRYAFGMITAAARTREVNRWRKEWQRKIGLTEEQEEEMAVHVATYVRLVQSRAERYPNSTVLFEQRVPTGLPDGGAGTSDAVIVSPVHVEIIDLKYGSGKFVFVTRNPQLRLYGVGVLEFFGDILGDTEHVFITVCQPRMTNEDGSPNIATEEISAAELVAWRDSIIPIAEEALGDDAHFGPSEEACQWCPAAGQCRAQMEWATSADFGTAADTMTNEEIADALGQLTAIRHWCDAVEKVSLDKIFSKREQVPGWKVVRSGGRRSISDHEGAIQALLARGHSLDEISNRKAKGIGDLETLLGKAEFESVLSPFVSKPPGKPSLAPETDPRPSIDPNDEAQKEFSE
jgi:hypothetical protein